MDLDFISKLVEPKETKIVLLRLITSAISSLMTLDGGASLDAWRLRHSSFCWAMRILGLFRCAGSGSASS